MIQHYKIDNVKKMSKTQKNNLIEIFMVFNNSAYLRSS